MLSMCLALALTLALAQTDELVPTDHGCDKPFQLISIHPATAKLAVSESAVGLLAQCFAEPFHVVSVSGSFHSGKSFLLNALVNRTSHFEVGRTTESQTRGLWVSAPVHRDGLRVVFVDSEGFAAAENTEQHDAKIYSISTLISAHQLFNSIRNIDAHAIEALELLARRARLFQLRSVASGQDTTTDEFLNTKEGALLNFPSLTWVVQNFHQQQLPDETPSHWLHRLLRSVATSQQMTSASITGTGKQGPMLLAHPSNTEVDNDNNERNHRKSSTLLNIFATMEAVTMTMPTYDPVALADLGQANILNKLSEEYLHDLNTLWQTIEEALHRSTRKQSGATLHTFLKVLVQSSNNNNVDALPSAWENYISTQKQSARLAVSNIFSTRALAYDFSTPLPMKTYTSDMTRLTIAANKNVVQLLFGLSSPTIESTKTMIQNHVDSLKAEKLEHNLKKIRSFANDQAKHSGDLFLQEMDDYPLPTPSSNIKRSAQAIASKLTKDFEFSISAYAKKSTAPFSDALQKVLRDKVTRVLELNRKEMDTIMNRGRANGKKAFDALFRGTHFPGTHCHVTEMYQQLKSNAVKVGTTAFDAVRSVLFCQCVLRSVLLSFLFFF